MAMIRLVNNHPASIKPKNIIADTAGPARLHLVFMSEEFHPG